jgi:hypothetical protein
VTRHLLLLLSLKERGRFVRIWPQWTEKPRSPGATLPNYPSSSTVVKQPPTRQQNLAVLPFTRGESRRCWSNTMIPWLRLAPTNGSCSLYDNQSDTLRKLKHLVCDTSSHKLPDAGQSSSTHYDRVVFPAFGFSQNVPGNTRLLLANPDGNILRREASCDKALLGLSSSMIQNVFTFFLNMGIREGPSNPQAAVGSGSTVNIVTIESGFRVLTAYLTAFKE